MDLRKLVSKPDISEREEAGLEILEMWAYWDGEQRMSVSIGMKDGFPW